MPRLHPLLPLLPLDSPSIWQSKFPSNIAPTIDFAHNAPRRQQMTLKQYKSPVHDQVQYFLLSLATEVGRGDTSTRWSRFNWKLEHIAGVDSSTKIGCFSHLKDLEAHPCTSLKLRSRATQVLGDQVSFLCEHLWSGFSLDCSALLGFWGVPLLDDTEYILVPISKGVQHGACYTV